MARTFLIIRSTCTHTSTLPFSLTHSLTLALSHSLSLDSSFYCHVSLVKFGPICQYFLPLKSFRVLRRRQQRQRWQRHRCQQRQRRQRHRRRHIDPTFLITCHTSSKKSLGRKKIGASLKFVSEANPEKNFSQIKNIFFERSFTKKEIVAIFVAFKELGLSDLQLVDFLLNPCVLSCTARHIFS